jgi:hypothetical protein
MHYGLRSANYPITEEDFERRELPPELRQLNGRLYGLTIDPRRLQTIREERRPGSEYASLQRCRQDVRDAQTMLKRIGVTVLNTTNLSIEEISAQILRALRTPAG